MHIPSSTYRVQLHQGFTFSDLENILDYLHNLGISAVYASPILKATPGSLHGYDVVDPHCVNPEIGTLDDLRRLSRKLKERKMLWIQDIVPNHMAFHTDNFRLMDVLERGSSSPYYRYFDIDWEHHDKSLRGKVQVPFLGSDPATAIDNNELLVALTDSGFVIKYHDQAFPFSLSAYPVLFHDHDPGIFPWDDLVKMGQDAVEYRDWKNDKEAYISSIINDEKLAAAVSAFLETVNADKPRLGRLLDHQFYRLSNWKDAARVINYRRFFTVNELICLRMEDESVFQEYHRFLRTLYEEGIFQGFRIDHIDGLQDPGQYVARLRKLMGVDCYIIAEKILESREAIPEQWPLQGTSGYEFLSYVSQLLTNRQGAKQLLGFYRAHVPEAHSYDELVLRNKKKILQEYMAGEWCNLAHLFQRLGLPNPFGFERIRAALGALMVSLPVYRIYPTSLPLKGEALTVMNDAFDKAQAESANCSEELAFLKQLLTTEHSEAELNGRALAFLKRVMQFTGPLTAKGVEDTTFYVYNALISHDEVGDSPSQLGISVGNFHNRMIARQQSNPLSLNATATHDTKRGEDARVRLNVLCDFPDLWQTQVSEWLQLNKQCRSTIGGHVAPTLNDEYYIYQSIVGGFPEDMEVNNEWLDRLQAYLVKALREAKVRSDWADPDEGYEQACGSFIRMIFERDSAFMQSFVPFQRRIMNAASGYSLAQVLLRITAPGIPDTYQGCELWDLSFVDPDNRRPVDYATRMDYLAQVQQCEKEGADVLFALLDNKREKGIEKLYVTWKSLQVRREHDDLFREGRYLPVAVNSDGGPSAMAYLRNHGSQWVLVVVTLNQGRNGQNAFAEQPTLALPADAPGTWRNVFTDSAVSARDPIAQMLGSLSVGLFIGD